MIVLERCYSLEYLPIMLDCMYGCEYESYEEGNKRIVKVNHTSIIKFYDKSIIVTCGKCMRNCVFELCIYSNGKYALRIVGKVYDKYRETVIIYL